ncbi:MAG: DNA-processing protein DprA [Armatimonadota bacterium]|nr:DNA-processing protein DprA [Armatimonadota bacterium]
MRRNAEFWQSLLLLEMAPRKARETLELLAGATSREDLLLSPALSAEQRATIGAWSYKHSGENMLTIDDNDYPENLRHARTQPIALSVLGEILPQDAASVAIVGTRKASPYGKTVAKRMARDLAKHGVTVVSGGAYGIDAAAHEGALDAGGRTIAVLGNGVDVAYPATHRGLFSRVVVGGALVSEYANGVAPDYWRFPQRNYLLATLTRAVIVIEAPLRSGSLITASAAGDEGRHVFATPGPIDSKEHEGSFRLINDGAVLLYDVQQVLDALGIHRRPDAEGNALQELSALQSQILQKLSTTPALADTISEELGEPPGVVLSNLTQLELDGLVARAAGGFVRL